MNPAIRILVLVTLIGQAACAGNASLHRRADASDELPATGTFSIIAYDSASGQLGGAVQSRVFSVGNGVLWAEAGVGIAATQAIVDVSYGPQALALLRQGKSASEVVKTVWQRDPDPDTTRWSKYGRQFAVVDAKGNVAAYTGPRATPWAGDRRVHTSPCRGTSLLARASSTRCSPRTRARKGHWHSVSLPRSKPGRAPAVMREANRAPHSSL